MSVGFRISLPATFVDLVVAESGFGTIDDVYRNTIARPP
jgi:hypothetical protein